MAPVPFRTISQEAPLGAEPAVPAYLVNSSPDAWQEVADALPPEAVEAGRQAAEDEIVLVAFAGARGSSGYQITITDIWQADDRLLVTVMEQRPDPNEIVEPAMTLPYHAVALNAGDVAPEITTILFQDEHGARLVEKVLPSP